MRSRLQPKHKRMLALLAVLTVVLALAAATRTTASSVGSCALGANCSEGCWTTGKGDPYPGVEPYCIADEDSPPCYICIYNIPGPSYDACAENPSGSEFYCSFCRIGGTPSYLPECP